MEKFQEYSAINGICDDELQKHQSCRERDQINRYCRSGSPKSNQFLKHIYSPYSLLYRHWLGAMADQSRGFGHHKLHSQKKFGLYCGTLLWSGRTVAHLPSEVAMNASSPSRYFRPLTRNPSLWPPRQTSPYDFGMWIYSALV